MAPPTAPPMGYQTFQQEVPQIAYLPAQPAVSQMAYHPTAYPMTPGMAYTACYPGDPGSQGIYQTAHHPLASNMPYSPGSSIGHQALNEKPPMSGAMLRLYPLRDLSLSSTQHFDKKDPFVILLLLLAAHNIDFEYVKMADLSRQLPERHLWLKNPFEASVMLKPYVNIAGKLLDIAGSQNFSHGLQKPQRRRSTPSRFRHRQKNRSPLSPRGSVGGSPRQERAKRGSRPGGLGGIRRGSKEKRKRSYSWKPGLQKLSNHTQQTLLENEWQWVVHGNRTPSPYTTTNSNSQGSSTGRQSLKPKQEEDDGMSLAITQHTSTDTAQHTPSILKYPHAPRNITFSSGSANQFPKSESCPGPLSEHSTLVRDIRLALMTVISEPRADLNAELPSYPCSGLQSCRSA